MSALDKLIELAREKRGKIVADDQQPAYCLWDLVWVVKDNNDWCARLIWVKDTDHLYQLREQRRILHLYVALDVPRDDFENDGRVRETLKQLRDVTDFEDDPEEAESIPYQRMARQQTPQWESADGNPQGCGEVILGWIVGIGVTVTVVGWLINLVVQILLWIVRTPPALIAVVSLIVGPAAGVIANGKSRIGLVLAGVVLGAAVGTGLGSAAFAFSGADSVLLYGFRVVSTFFCSGIFAALVMRYGQEEPQVQRWWWPLVGVLSTAFLIAGLVVTMNERTNQLLLASRPQQIVPSDQVPISDAGQADAVTSENVIARNSSNPLEIVRPDRDPKAMGYKRLYDLTEDTCDQIGQVGETKHCQATVNAGQSYVWGSAWCATKKSATSSLLNSTGFQYFIDGKPISPNQFWTGRTSTCLRRRLIVKNFEAGSQHEFRLVIQVARDVSDSSEVYKAGRYELQLDVTVQ
jgi:hypothetical protein